ncbi:HD domain-containing protein [uncultured Pseudodesulfovibrio sp.]|uniref:HD domain-containing protein n=1 Tax=uncultured Pseudodesulfovibrio sp. TaxID=2035858 RepID=UPI0029C68E59|nr:HD domain-containing protein [uncultured Pseudodesulfovibrio sp.]
MSLRPHVKAFTRFAESHLTGNEADDALIRLKIDHSFRVQDNAALIAAKENLPAHNARLCELAALYHDIGRFPQYSKFRTFKDSESANHARLGVLALRQILLPDDVPQDDWRTIRLAVAQHNVMHIRDSLPMKLATPTQVVRDADKLDIFNVILSHFESEGPLNSVIAGGVADEPDKYSMSMYSRVYSGKLGIYNDMLYANDFKLLLISWVFDLHWASSIQLLSERKYLDRAFDALPDDDNIEKLKEKVFNFMRYNPCLAP